MNVHLCDTAHTATGAIALIALQPLIYLDCEGSDLGAVDGNISILSIGIPSPNANPDVPASPQIYLFDCLLLPVSCLAPLLAVLSSSAVRKLVWDGRQDFSEIFHRFGTPLVNVLDLQLVDIHSRFIRKEGDLGRLRRISLKCHPMWQVSLLETDGVHGLVGLKRAPREHLVYIDDLEEEGYYRCASIYLTSVSSFYLMAVDPISHGRWMERPLPPAWLHYAAKDIVLLARIHAHFAKSGYLHENDQPLLLKQSARYIALHKGARPAKQKNVFVSSAFCPLEILDGDAVEAADRPRAGRVCTKCQREFRFPKSFPSAPDLDEVYRDTCKLCMFLMIRQPLLEQSRKPGA